MFIRKLFALRSVLIVVAVASCTACVGPEKHVYEPIAHHTLKSGADSESDVVWVQKYTAGDGKTKLFRCSATGGAPRCDAVNEATTTASAK